jgi:hypothetical protein
MKTLLIAVGAAALMSGAALAQTADTSVTDQSAAPAASADSMASDPSAMSSDPSATPPADPSASMGTPAAPMDPSANSTMAPPSNSMSTTMAANGTNVQTVTNGPIPDTPENRAKYGKPMSNAGKRSTAAGN